MTPTAAAILAALPAEHAALIWCRAGVAAGDAERRRRGWPDLPRGRPRTPLVPVCGATPTPPPQREDL